jgi:hypothetical protein
MAPPEKVQLVALPERLLNPRLILLVKAMCQDLTQDLMVVDTAPEALLLLIPLPAVVLTVPLAVVANGRLPKQLAK